MLKSMLQHLREDARAEELEGEGAAEAGFTLIELMVVLLIIAILLAIAIPTFLGVTSSANNRAAQSNLTNAFTEASAAYQNNNQSYVPPGTLDEGSWLQQSAPEFTWTTVASTSQNEVSADDADGANGQALVLAVWSKPTSTCWALLNIQQNESVNVAGMTTPNAGTYYGEINAAGTTSAECVAADVTGFTTAGTSYGYAATLTSTG